MYKRTHGIIACALGLGVHMTSYADPVGLWKTVDEHTGQARSLVRITQSGGTYVGRIEKTLFGSDVCPERKCTGAYAGRSLIGATILWNAQHVGGNVYEGKVLDPQNGKTYSGEMRDNGSTMVLRGYVLGIKALGRSQTWYRVQ